MFVNKSVLDACGIEVPGPDYTWDQFLADCQTILDNGYTPIACSLVEVPHYWFEFVVMNNGSLDNQLDVPASMDDAAAAKWVAGLNDIKDLYERGFFPKNTLTATDAETVAMFGEGEAAFLIDGSWKVGYFTGNHEDTLEDYAISYVPGKGDRPASDAIGGISMGYFITRKAWEDPAKREAAVEFVSYLTSDEVLSNFVTTEVTALVNGAKPEGLNILQQSAADANAAITGIAGAVQDTITSEAKGDLFGNIQNVVTGKMTAEEAVASAIALN
jgi:raffinose/stachyose/melibiose transport system substrate-binding protein